VKRIAVGDMAPDFVLKDNKGEEVKLSGLRGKKVLLSWHPLAWTGVCAEQMKSLEANLAEFEKNNTVPLGMSIDSSHSKNAWAKSLEITGVRMPADFWPHGKVAQDFGLFRDVEGFSERANVLIDEAGKVVWVKVYEIPQLPDIKEVLSVVRGGK
jgi:peroxiredoxin